MGKTRRRASTGNRFGMAMIAMIVLILIVVLLMRSKELSERVNTFEGMKVQLEQKIEEAKARQNDLVLVEEYVHSDEYIAKVARDKFGLVRKGEIIYRARE